MHKIRALSYSTIVLITLGTFFGISNKVLAAAEQRCNELVANCVCSEPLNTSIYVQDTNSYFNPADTTSSDKQCLRAPGFPGTTLEDGAGFRYVVETSGEMLTALPAGHLPGLKVLRTKTTAEGNTSGGGQFLGHNFSPNDPTARRSFRFYMYWSPTYQLENLACVNSSKIVQFGIMPSLSVIFSGNGNYDLYGWTGWMKDPLDCCIRGPGTSTTWGTYTEPAIQGKWFRFELVATNVTSAGAATNLTIYMKNVTDNLPEVTVIDTTVPTTQPNGLQWDSILATTLKPASGNSINEMFIDAFRNGTCSGYKGFSHLLAAAWDTNAGQRIGAACEVEGGCGTPAPTPTPDTTAPSVPTNLTATAVSTTQINLSWTASTDNIGVTGYRIYRGGTQIATAAGTTYSDTALTPSTAYSYTVSAYDVSGNASIQSASVSATTQTAPVAVTTPVGLWSFDTADLTTTTALDRSGLSNTLTLVSTPARVTGKVNQALSFDGISSTASCTDASCGGTTKLDMGTSNWTVSAWVKTTATGNIVTKSGFICGGNPDGWTVYISGTGTLQVGINDSAAGCVFSPSDGAIINNGSWHHVTAVFNRAGNLVRYVDGVQTGTQTSIASLSGVSIDSAAEFRIGSRDATGDSGFLNGAIDEVKVYPRALSLSEIQTLAAAGTPVTDTSAPAISLTAPTPSTTVSGTTVTVSASASDNVGVSGVQFKLDGATLGTEDTTTPYSITWNTTSATNGTHTLTATARDAAGNITTSTGVSVTVSNVLSDTSPPTTPSGLTATAISTTQINLSWSAATDNVGVTGYKIYRNGTQIATSATNSYSNTGLTASTAYSYTVSAYDAAGNTSVQSASASATTQASSLASSGGQYFNSSEAGCNGSDSSVLFCDDFEDGSWAQSNCDFLGGTAYAPNNGWCMTIYHANADGSYTNGTNGSGFNQPIIPGYAVCGTAGAGGTNCAVTSAVRSGNSGMMGSHNLNGGSYRDVYYRLYFKNLNGYIPGHEKMFGLATQAGTNYLLQMSYNPFGSNMLSSMTMQNQDINPGSWQSQNLGNTLTLQNNNWYYIEEHVKLNTLGQADGAYEMWLDNCGTTGTQCTGSGTLRSQYNNLIYVTPADVQPNAQLGAFWLENWSNAPSVGETYYDQIKVATTRIGPMPISGTPTPIPDTTAPSVPSGLTTSVISSSQINLSWNISTDNIGVTGYKIFRNGTQIATTATNSYANTALTPSTAYSYTVAAYDLAGNTSGQSASASATTQTPPTTSTKFILTDRVQATATLNVRTTASVTGTLLGSQSSGTLGTIIGGPTNSGGFNWWNVNYDTGVDGWSVEDYLVKYVAPIADTTTPSVPINLSTTALSTTQINLSWSASTDNVGVTGYRIYRNGVLLTTTTATSYANTGLSANTAYTYTVAAYDAAGNTSAQSSSASATTQASSPTASGGQYFNSNEPMCNGTDPSVLFCDDFEDGDWYKTNELNGGGGRFNPINDGWLGNTFAPLDSQGYGRCGLLGVAGTNCTSTSGNRSGSLAEGFHYFAPSETIYNEIYHRFYVKFSPGYQFGHEKLVFYQQSDSGGSTEQVAVLMTPFGNNTFDYTVMLPDIRAGQNQGNNLNFIPGHWYYMEVHIRLDSPMGAGNGIIETWADDCGTDGKGCTGPGTLRQVYTGNIRPSASKGLGVIWQENWSNSSTMTAVGEVYNDQVIVRTTRIGPMPISGTPTPPPDTTAPSVPSSLTATALSTTQINLSWSASIDNVGVTGYKIYRNGTQIATTATNSYSNTSLTPSTAYSYTVAAYDLAGNTSGQSASASATTQTPPTTSTKFILNDRVQSTATLNVRATASATGTLLGSQSTNALGTIIGGPVNADGFNWWNVNYDTGVDGWSVEDYLVKYVAPIADTTTPSVPINLSTTALSTTQINLSWSASTDNVGVTGYRIYRNGVLLTTTTATSYANTGLSANTAYTYTVAAYDAAGNTSAQSAGATVTTQALATTPATPTTPSTNTNTSNTSPTNTTSPAGGSSGGVGSTATTPATSSTYTPPSSPTTTTTPSLSLTRTLYRGTKGTDVKSLQSFLIQQNYLAPLSDTGFYGPLTKQAVEKYQCAQSLICSGTEVSTGYGVVGPKTRAKLNGSSSSSYVSTSTLTPAQADSIIALIQSFGADAAVIARVKVVLGR